MPSTLHQHLAHRLGAAFRRLERALDGVDTAAATAGADPDWRRYRWGVGLDGSIAGIVWHVAAWKALVAAGLGTGAFPSEGGVHPPEPGWEGLRAWLRGEQAALADLLDGMPDETLEQRIAFGGEEMSVAVILAHMIEHDQYHAGQVNLLRQLRGPVPAE